jgi:putative acetyltransferase
MAKTKMPDGGIERLDPDDPEVRQLIAAADDFYHQLYPADSNHLESIEDLRRPGTLFVGCRLAGRLAASGAAKVMNDDGIYGEIKRVFVYQDYRGQGLSHRIMDYLESQLRRQGIEFFRLETGIYQPEALALYRKLGYRERGPFGAYHPDPLSVFMEKRVDRKTHGSAA